MFSIGDGEGVEGLSIFPFLLELFAECKGRSLSPWSECVFSGSAGLIPSEE